MTARLLVVHHTPSPTLHELLTAVLEGAGSDELPRPVEVVSRPALTAGAADALAADAIVLGTPANIGTMSGALKHFFDQVYYPCLDQSRGLGFGLYVHGGDDTAGAVRDVTRITGALGWEQVTATLEATGAPTAAHRESAWELGATVALHALGGEIPALVGHTRSRSPVVAGMTSRAVQYRRYGGPEVLEIVERDDPTPGEGQVRLAVRAASVNPIDWKLRSGAMASGAAPGGPTGTGVDVAGVVDALGAGVTEPAVGTAVLGHASGGAFAEAALADASALVVKPEQLSFEQAATLPVAATTAYRALALLGLGEHDATEGRTLLVEGASGAVGVFAVQLAVARGVTVVGTAGGARQDDVAALGATPVVYGEGHVDRVRAAAPQGVDAAFDTSGAGVLGELVALTGSADRVVTIADYAGAQEHGVRFTSGSRAEEVAGALADAAARVADGRLRTPTIVTYPFDRAVEAQADNESGRVRGKLVVTV